MRRVGVVPLFVFTGLFAISTSASQRYLQILHVNDTHSYWTSNEEDGGGGLARIKTILDKLEKEGDAQGWVTIRLDAGDFSDGHLNFLANRGTTSFKIERALKFDAIALGNHDYLTGLYDLIGRAHDSEQRLPLVAANFNSFHYAGVDPGLMIYRGGLKIAVGGATLKSDLYNWAAWPTQFEDPLDPLEDWLATHPADIHIALTHVGVPNDRAIVLKSKEIDVVIGGHTHTALFDPYMVFNKLRRRVPILQAGSHGSYVGKTVMRIVENQKPELVDYKLIRVDDRFAEDPEIKKLVEDGHNSLKKEIAPSLFEVVATSETRYPTHIGKTPLIGNFIGDAMREVTGAEIALDSGFLYGDRLKRGDVTVADIFGLAPHTYNWGDQGWHIFTCDAYPLSIRLALAKLASSSQNALVISGLELAFNRYYVPRRMKVNGRSMNYFRPYKTAFSEGFIEALAGRPKLEKLLCANLLDTGILLRDALLRRARELKVFSDKTLGPPRVVFW